MRFDAATVGAIKVLPVQQREMLIGLLQKNQQHKLRLACMSREELAAWAKEHPFDAERLEKAHAKRQRKAEARA